MKVIYVILVFLILVSPLWCFGQRDTIMINSFSQLKGDAFYEVRAANVDGSISLYSGELKNNKFIGTWIKVTMVENASNDSTVYFHNESGTAYLVKYFVKEKLVQEDWATIDIEGHLYLMRFEYHQSEGRIKRVAQFEILPSKEMLTTRLDYWNSESVKLDFISDETYSWFQKKRNRGILVISRKINLNGNQVEFSKSIYYFNLRKKQLILEQFDKKNIFYLSESKASKLIRKHCDFFID